MTFELREKPLSFMQQLSSFYHSACMGTTLCRWFLTSHLSLIDTVLFCTPTKVFTGHNIRGKIYTKVSSPVKVVYPYIFLAVSRLGWPSREQESNVILDHLKE